MIKEFFVALISFTLMAFAVVGLMFLVDQYAFPPLAETSPTPPPAGKDREKPPAPAEERRPPSPEPKAMAERAPAEAPPAAAPSPSGAEIDIAVERPAVDVAESAPATEPLREAPESGKDAPATGPVEEAGAEVSTAPLSPQDDADRIENLSIGEQAPLSDGRIAYRVAPGDTFSRIVKQVIGTGRPSVWQDRAARMAIDHRRIAPGMVLIFDPPTASERASEG